MKTLTLKCILYFIYIQISYTNPINKIVSSTTSSITSSTSTTSSTNCINNNETNVIIECNITNIANITNDFNNSINSTIYNETIININDNNKLEQRLIRDYIILGCSLFVSLLIICYYDYKNGIGCKSIKK